MTDRINDMDDLFSMFHDFEIVGLQLDDKILSMEILLLWSEMWEIEDYKMTFCFDGCKNLKRHYWTRTSNELKEWEKGVHYPSEEHVTTDPNEITKLELDVQSHDFNEPEKFGLHCNSSSSHGNQIGQIEFGRIERNATDYQIFDNEVNEMSLDKMKSWGTEWWDSIQKMWDEQKAKKSRHANKAYSLWQVYGHQQGFSSVASFGFGGQESASKPPQAICKTLATTKTSKTLL